MIAMMAVLWRRFETRWVRVACGCGGALAASAPLYFTLRHYYGLAV